PNDDPVCPINLQKLWYVTNAFAFNIQTVLLLVLTVLASCWLLWRFITRLRKGFGKESCSAGI
ncbi:MAG TPA: hypothetical protein PLQ42_05940, partial [Candidatus Hydrogenedentes bacterium]|nr:hypothetical protein [Candidatus Hydrogenedentota bacterium]HOM49014.1 hypothetical protein [Candidatus Hydrogenedentota bacterium]HOR50605.1 hypothetical protein [Candidatus Hydrogenedentota bacterium]